MTAWTVQIELPLREDWHSVDRIRQAVVACLNAAYQSPESCEVLGIAVSELVENAIKYGDWNSPKRCEEARVRLLAGTDRIEIVVSHPVPPDGFSVRRLLDLIRRIESAPSPEEAYIEQIRVARWLEGEGGLGLARIAYEARCRLSAVQREGGALEVRAVIEPALLVLPASHAAGALSH